MAGFFSERASAKGAIAAAIAGGSAALIVFIIYVIHLSFSVLSTME